LFIWSPHPVANLARRDAHEDRRAGTNRTCT
jgi:hypothetical protein